MVGVRVTIVAMQGVERARAQHDPARVYCFTLTLHFEMVSNDAKPVVVFGHYVPWYLGESQKSGLSMYITSLSCSINKKVQNKTAKKGWESATNKPRVTISW